jgi:hypothetical protein
MKDRKLIKKKLKVNNEVLSVLLTTIESEKEEENSWASSVLGLFQ